MNHKESTIRILCFGDSNVWGRSGQSVDRYPKSLRWTYQLQEKLGEGFEIIEEGLRSRTTDLNDDDPQFPGRNGLAYLRPCLESQSPLDMVIVWLGTNDLKTKFNRSPEQVTQAMQTLIEMTKNVTASMTGKTAQIILIAPPLVREEVLKPNSAFSGAGEKSKKLPTLYRELAARMGCHFIDMSSHVQAGEFDGVHLEPESHPKVTEVLFATLKTIYP